MRPPLVDRRQAPIRLSFVLAALAACSGTSGSAPAPSDCARAADHFEDLRVAALRADPVLAAVPGAADEHARQTRAAFTQPLQARCGASSELAHCVLASTSYDQATTCR